jgi:hypothetical protein
MKDESVVGLKLPLFYVFTFCPSYAALAVSPI